MDERDSFVGFGHRIENRIKTTREVEMNTKKTFPIQHPAIPPLIPLTVPYHIAEEAYKEYVLQGGRGQTLERLAERGGFGWAEIIHLLFDRIVRIEGK